LGPVRTVLFSLVVLCLTLTALEFAAARTESTLPSLAIDPSSPLYFQQLPKHPPLQSTLELATLHGVDLDLGEFDPEAPDAEHLTITEQWVDLNAQTIVLPKPESEIRIIVVGGSAIGGWGMPETATAVGIAERLLGQALPDRSVRIYNLARTGLGSPQLSFILAKLAPRIQPDLVVTVMGNNERLDIAAGVHAVRDDREQVELLTSPLALLGPLQDLHPWLRLLVGRSALVRRLWLAKAGSAPAEDSAIPDEPSEDEESGSDENGELMPPLSKTRWPEAIESFALHRLGLTLAAIDETTRAAGAQLLVATVPVNHRYRHPEHEWHFFGMQLFRNEDYRTAHWAYYYEAAEQGAAAMRRRLAQHPGELPARLLLGHFLLESGQTDEAAQHLNQVITPLRARLQLSLEEPSAPWQGDEELLLAWALRLLEGNEAAMAEIQPLLAKPHWIGSADGASTVCHAVDLRWYAGDMEGAREAAESCLRESYYYRADRATNVALAEYAEALGGSVLDLAGEVAQHSAHGIPDYRFFLDYCHYNPRGNLLIGYLLAAGIAEQLGPGLSIPPPVQALERHRRRRLARLTDLPELDEWVGVNFDVTLLTSERYGEQAHDRREGDEASALSAVFDGNELASERYLCFGQCGCHCSASFGPRRTSLREKDAVQAARAAYLLALERQPELTASRRNIALLGGEM